MNQSSRLDLLIATNNSGKVREFSSLLSGLPFRLHFLAAFPQVPEAIETGSTFTANAEIKARHYASQTGFWTLADDSGLEVEALGGAPGVYSARYAGARASDAERTARLLSELDKTNDLNRRARFVCVICLVEPESGAVETFEGSCEGSIIHEPRGQNGFGYDPVFIPDGHGQTFGELPSEIKQKISHRARALAGVVNFLRREIVHPP